MTTRPMRRLGAAYRDAAPLLAAVEGAAEAEALAVEAALTLAIAVVAAEMAYGSAPYQQEGRETNGSGGSTGLSAVKLSKDSSVP